MLVKDKQHLLRFLAPLKGAWITGTSGSGKSIIGHTLKSEKNTVYDLDTDGQHCKFPSGLDLWICDSIKAFDHDYVVGTCDNDTQVLDNCKFKHVILSKLPYELYVQVMKAKAEDHAKRHGKKDAFASDFGKKSKYTRSQQERAYRETVKYFRALSVVYNFQVHELHLDVFPDVELVPWARKGF